MRSRTLKWILFASTITIIIIIAVQLYWLNKVYRFEEHEFNSNVVKSVRGLFEDIDIASYPDKHLTNLIEYIEPDIFIVQIDSIAPRDSIIHHLTSEFEDFEVMSDCKVALYDKSKGKYLYQVHIQAPGSNFKFRIENEIDLPLLNKPYPYLYLKFPHRQQYIVQKLGLWIGTSVLLFILMLALPATLFYLYKQKSLNELQKDFVNNFTHEFKTPLAVMKLASDVLTSPAIIEKPDRLKRYSTIIKQQTEHLQYQVERLLKTSTTDERHLQLEKSDFDLNELITDVIHQLDPLIIDKHARIEFHPSENGCIIHADKTHISLVIVNLLENAIKYSKQPIVIASIAQSGNHTMLSIKDNGIGIRKEHQKYIFKKFYRIPTGDVHNVKGFGLGLNFVKKVIQAHNGKITLNSIVDIGTEFKITLPKQ